MDKFKDKVNTNILKKTQGRRDFLKTKIPHKTHVGIGSRRAFKSRTRINVVVVFVVSIVVTVVVVVSLLVLSLLLILSLL